MPPRFVPGHGNAHAKIVFLGEAPGRVENETGRPFTGPSGDLLDSILEDIGYEDYRDECYITNVLKYQPPYNNFNRASEVCNIKEQYDLLEQELLKIKPNVIIALGDKAFEAVTGRKGITKWRGSILHSKWGIPKVVPTLHPANILREEDDEDSITFPYIYKQVIASDIAKAIEESKYADLRLPERHIKIAHDGLSVARFIREHHGLNPYIDIETFNSTLPVCLSLCFNRYHTIVIPIVREIHAKIKRKKGIYSVTHQISTRTDSESAEVLQLLDDLFRQYPISGQNIKFDAEKLSLIGFRFRGIRSDTSVKSHVINPELPERTLNFLASINTREPYYKDEGKEFVYGRDDISQLFNYCGRDSLTTAEIDEVQETDLEEMSDQYHVDMKKFYYDFVMRSYPLYMEMERRGFAVDEGESERLRKKYEGDLTSKINRLRTITALPDFNPNSPKQCAELVYGQLGFPARGRRGKVSTDEKTLTALLANNVKNDTQRESLELMLESRRYNKTIGTYITVNRDFDGRLRSGFRNAATVTGRSNSSSLKPPVRPYKQGMAFQTLTKHGDIGADIRRQLIADPGFVIVNVDKQQADAQVVCVLAEDYKLLDAMKRVDTHKRTAALAIGLTDKIILDQFSPYDARIKPGERFLGKKVRHAGGYDVKKHEGMMQINKEARRLGLDLNLSEWKVGQMLDRFHQASPNIRGVFHRDIKYALDNGGRVLITPLGRVREFFGRWNDQLYKEAYAHIPQSTVIDDLRRSMIAVDEWRQENKAEIRFHCESHDSVTFQMPLGEYKDYIKNIKPLFSLPIDFNNGTIKRNYILTIPIDIEIGVNYKDLEKYTEETSDGIVARLAESRN